MDVGYARTLEELASRSDIFTVHLPLKPQTRGAVNRAVLEALPDGAMVINTARSEVLDYAALDELIPKKGLRVGLDVFSSEPDRGSAPFEAPILGRGVVYGTPHIGASTEQSRRAIAQETASMKELVESLLFLARHDKKTLLLEMEDFDPVEVVAALHREAKMLSPSHNFLLSPMEHCQITADKNMLKQVMRVLCDNAVKYTPAGGTITLGVKKTMEGCMLSVTDTGSGIAPDDLSKVFDRFYRSDSVRKSTISGHGLGLSIARIIVIAHGGRISVRSKLGAGTTFKVYLPENKEKAAFSEFIS
jgi:signal transduction histidine kinase